MYMFRKKHFALILCFLFFSFTFYLADNTAKRNYDITQVSSVPVDGKVIVIDAGHGRR